MWPAKSTVPFPAVSYRPHVYPVFTRNVYLGLDDFQLLSKPFPSTNIFLFPGKSHSCGLVTIVSDVFTSSLVTTRDHGRLLTVDVSVDSYTYLVTKVYSPNAVVQRLAFRCSKETKMGRSWSITAIGCGVIFSEIVYRCAWKRHRSHSRGENTSRRKVGVTDRRRRGNGDSRRTHGQSSSLEGFSPRTIPDTVLTSVFDSESQEWQSREMMTWRSRVATGCYRVSKSIYGKWMSPGGWRILAWRIKSATKQKEKQQVRRKKFTDRRPSRRYTENWREIEWEVSEL